jgi:hypothetical protein
MTGNKRVKKPAGGSASQKSELIKMTLSQSHFTDIFAQIRLFSSGRRALTAKLFTNYPKKNGLFEKHSGNI